MRRAGGLVEHVLNAAFLQDFRHPLQVGTFGLTVGDEQQVIVLIEPLGIRENAVIGCGKLFRILVTGGTDAEFADDDDAAESADPGEEVTVSKTQVIGLLGTPGEACSGAVVAVCDSRTVLMGKLLKR